MTKIAILREDLSAIRARLNGFVLHAVGDGEVRPLEPDAPTPPDKHQNLKATGALLYKAKAMRPKDEADFDACLPTLDRAACTWLSRALTQAHPGHPWLAPLGVR